ncbi:hypothetical protein IFM89_039332 [Coptis chinensis]|uniref:ACB domain-containing protein n=1 Tax=Coptis chinensis TaxID=261450 RepID=A0A835HTF1_9MAGN|nr:hypothetical protein IFM89_039332 [Coptis chinensis]
MEFAKLFSILVSFKEGNFKLIRLEDDDWNEVGVETSTSTDLLDEEFNAATTFITCNVLKDGFFISNEVILELYGLYKIATHGPWGNDAHQTSALKVSNRAKWDAWQRLGDMDVEEAMCRYISIVTELYPSWANGSTSKNKDGDYEASSSAAKEIVGPVFSTFLHEDSDDELLRQPTRDSEGRTPLHWAVDRGHLKVAELLVSKKADVNVKDNEGQTPLHYASVCEREGIAEFLVNHGADKKLKDNDGYSPCDLCKLNWPWMQHSSTD